MKITIKDIARTAAVSEAAVSLALNNRPGVSNETRQYILKVANELGYEKMRQPKKNGEPRLIRFLICFNNDVIDSHYNDSPFFMTIIQNIEKACSKRGYALLISSTELKDLAESLKDYENNQPSLGLILLGTNVHEEDVLIVQRYQPKLVIIDNMFELLNVDCVGSNVYMTGHQAAAYLLNKGFSRFGYVQATQRLYNLEQAKKGFFETMEQHGVAIPDKHIYSITNSIEESYRDFKALLSSSKADLPEVLFCENDYMALAVMRALREEGIPVPKAVSVMGVDNVSLASTALPPLTTIKVDTEAMSRVAVDRIIEIIHNNGQPAMKFIIDTTLIERESCR